MDKLNNCFGYFDLNLRLEENSVKTALTAAKQLGYDVVAINTYLEESVFEPKKKKKGDTREVSDIVPAPLGLEDIQDETNKDLKILRRLTVEFSDSLQAHKLMQSDNFKKYDIVAVIPNSQNALQHSCSTLDVDVISFNPSNRLPLRFTRKIYTMAVDRGLYFELMYSPAIKDSAARRNIISVSHIYHAIGKSQNIFISSGGTDPYDLRGPYDVINLCLILGMNEEAAKQAISDGCRSLYIRAVGRRCGKAVIWVNRISSDDSSSSEDDEMELSSPNNDKLSHLSFAAPAVDITELASADKIGLHSSISSLKETNNAKSPSSVLVESLSSQNLEKHWESKHPKRVRTKSPSVLVVCDG